MPVILNKVIKDGSSEKVTLDHRREGCEKMGHVDGYSGEEGSRQREEKMQKP